MRPVDRLQPHADVMRHMVPNVMAPFLIMLTAFVGQAILLEASLSYLGLGVQEPTAAWGLMLQGGAEEFAESAPGSRSGPVWRSRWPCSASTCSAMRSATSSIPSSGRRTDAGATTWLCTAGWVHVGPCRMAAACPQWSLTASRATPATACRVPGRRATGKGRDSHRSPSGHLRRCWGHRRVRACCVSVPVERIGQSPGRCSRTTARW